ncbi:MAG: thiamine phosphate synthase [Xanthomonadales bacterium]|nr:thiamine phosphate synthase [Xanthomonadales bacterium]
MSLSRGIYGVYDRGGLADDALARVSLVLAEGLVCLQYRDKRTEAPDHRLIADLQALCRAHETPFIINDDWRLAAEVGADGVHLGQSDGDVAEARAALGPAAILGVSCQDRIDRARQALAAGADHVSFGRFFVSTTKPDAPPADPAVLARARSLGVPIVAIGGIDADNAARLVAAGADLVAVSRALFARADGPATAGRLRALFDQPAQ